MSSIEKDERLTPFPTAKSLQVNHPSDVPANYAPMYDDDVFHEGRSLKDYFLIVYKRLPIILAMTILITSVVAFYMYRLPSLFEGQTTMVITVPKPKTGAKGEAVYINFGYDGNYVNTQLRLLKTPELMREVVLRGGLYKDPNLMGKSNKGFIESLKSMFSREKTSENSGSLPVLTQNTEGTNVADINTLTPEEKARLESYTGQLLGTLQIEQVQNTDLVNVKLTSHNPDLIPRVTDLVAEVHIEQDAKRAMQGQEDAYKDLVKSIDELKANINKNEAELMRRMQDENLPLTGEKGADFNAMRLNTLSSQYLEAMNNRRKLQAEYEAASAAINKGQPYKSGVGGDYYDKERENLLKMQNDLDNRLDNLDKQITDAESKVAQLKVTKTEFHPDVKIAQALVDKLKADRKKAETDGEAKIKAAENKQKKTANSETLTNLQSKLAAANRSENDLRAAYFQARNASNAAGTASTRLTTLNSEIETERNLLNNYVQTQKTMELAISGSRPDNIIVSSKAMKPEAPIGPQRNRNIFIAFFLSFGIGIGLAFLLDYLDDSIKTSDDIGKHLGLATLALIPHESVLGKKKKKSLAGGNGNKSPSSTALITLEDSRSAMAEAYRHLRTSLLFSSAGKPPQVVLVTSSQPSEGKTTTAINTAIALAQSGADVVIIDCDLRRPRLHQHFAMDNNTGLTNFLSGDKNTEGLLKPYPAYPKLKVITSGPIPPNPAELLSSAEMQELLRDLRGKFNHIVIDSPPAISFADAAILSTVVDGVILVAMAGKSSIQLIKRFKQRLNTIGTRIYGVVLNGIKPDSFEYGYYGYGYDYGYEDNDDDSTPRMDDDYDTIIRK
jgi:capsular exopolysaccharide synthesis family protein